MKTNQIDAKKMHVSAASLAANWSVRKATPSDNTERTARSGAVVETTFLSRPQRAQCIHRYVLRVLFVFQSPKYAKTKKKETKFEPSEMTLLLGLYACKIHICVFVLVCVLLFFLSLSSCVLPTYLLCSVSSL